MTLLAYLTALYLRLTTPPACPRQYPCRAGDFCVRWADSSCRARGERRAKEGPNTGGGSGHYSARAGRPR